jgi:DNA-binding MarR family transcriptional regulator
METNFGDLARNLSEVDRVMHEPSRLIIVTILYSLESADFLYLQRETKLTRGNLSSHLAKLEAAGYIEIEKTYRGKIPLTLCRLLKPGRQAFESYHQQLRDFIKQTQPLSSKNPGGEQ